MGRAVTRAVAGVPMALVVGWVIGTVAVLPMLIADRAYGPQPIAEVPLFLAVGFASVLSAVPALVVGLPLWLVVDGVWGLRPADGARCGAAVGLVVAAALGALLGGTDAPRLLLDAQYLYLVAALVFAGAIAGTVAVKLVNTWLPARRSPPGVE